MNARSLVIARSVAVIGSTGALIAGVTFAAVGDLSSAMLTGNTLSASAALQIAPDASGSAGTFATSAAGFTTTTNGMQFGTERQAGSFWIKGTAATDQSVVVNIPTAPALSGVTANKVHVHIKKGAIDELNVTLDQLSSPSSGVALGNHISPSAGGAKYTLYYTIDTPTGGGVTASVGTFDLNFTGTEL